MPEALSLLAGGLETAGGGFGEQVNVAGRLRHPFAGGSKDNEAAGGKVSSLLGAIQCAEAWCSLWEIRGPSC